jgi:hypothetical protein
MNMAVRSISIVLSFVSGFILNDFYRDSMLWQMSDFFKNSPCSDSSSSITAKKNDTNSAYANSRSCIGDRCYGYDDVSTAPKHHPVGKPGFVWPSHTLGLDHRPATERPGMSTPAVSLADLLSGLLKNDPSSLHGYFVNVGAADGCLGLADPKARRECDEANQLLPLQAGIVLGSGTHQDSVRARNSALYEAKTFFGLLIELGSLKYHARVYQPEHYRGVQVGLNHANAQEVFEQAGVPKQFDVLKYDTDSADCDVLQVLLEANYQPNIIMAEYNLVFPPPLRFNQMSSPFFNWGAIAPHHQQLGNQCSLIHLSDIMRAHGYVLIQVDWWDAFYVRQDLVAAATNGAPLYDDLTWYLHGYVTNAPSNEHRATFLKTTAYRAAAVSDVVKYWLETLVKISERAGTSDPNASGKPRESEIRPYLNTSQFTAMRTDFWWLAAREGYVQVKDTKLGSSSQQRASCHDGCVPQPFTLA